MENIENIQQQEATMETNDQMTEVSTEKKNGANGLLVLAGVAAGVGLVALTKKVKAKFKDRKNRKAAEKKDPEVQPEKADENVDTKETDN